MMYDLDPEVIFALMEGEEAQFMLSFLTVQMSAKKGLKAGEDAIMKELEQLLYQKVTSQSNKNVPHSNI